MISHISHDDGLSTQEWLQKLINDALTEEREQIAREIEGLICTEEHLTPNVIAGCQVERYSYRRAARTARGK